jgi:hypothetical protein
MKPAPQPAQPVDPRELLARLSDPASDLTPGDVRLAWWLQQTSAAPGGMDSLVAALAEEFPERIQTRTMAKNPNPPGGVYGEQDVAETLDALEDACGGHGSYALLVHRGGGAGDEDETTPCPFLAEYRTSEKLKRRCVETAKANLAADLRASISTPAKRAVRIGRRVVDQTTPLDRFISAFPFPPEPRYFQDLPGALRELAARQTASWQAEQSSLPTTLRAACEALDWTLKTGCSAGLESPAGSLPANSLAGWAAAHRGSAIVFPVSPFGTKDTFASALAARLGLPPSKDANGVRAMLPEILRSSGMVLVLADAQNLLHYRYKGGSPGLVEWVVMFAREGIPVALCVDPQFIPELVLCLW